MQEWAKILQPTPIGGDASVNGTNHSSSFPQHPNNNASTNMNNNHNTVAESQSHSMMQQFLSQLGFGNDDTSHAVVVRPSENSNLAPAGSVPPQQTIPTRMEPVDPKRSILGSFSDWFLPNPTDGKRKFSSVGCVDGLID